MRARLFKSIARLLLAAMVCALGACSAFDAKWNAAKNPATAHGATRWDGSWTSAKHKSRNGAPEGGRLRCVVEPADARSLRASFHANWLALSANYTMTLAPVNGSRTDFRGTHDLPAIFGGTYKYTAHISGDRFTARYESGYDRGTFELSRVRP